MNLRVPHRTLIPVYSLLFSVRHTLLQPSWSHFAQGRQIVAWNLYKVLYCADVKLCQILTTFFTLGTLPKVNNVRPFSMQFAGNFEETAKGRAGWPHGKSFDSAARMALSPILVSTFQAFLAYCNSE